MNTILTDRMLSRVVLLSIFFLMSLTTFASDTGTNRDAEIIEDRDVLDAIKNIVEPEPSPENPSQVRIYNQELELIRIGDEELDTIKRLLARSDFIIEIGNLKIYRLSR